MSPLYFLKEKRSESLSVAVVGWIAAKRKGVESVNNRDVESLVLTIPGLEVRLHPANPDVVIVNRYEGRTQSSITGRGDSNSRDEAALVYKAREAVRVAREDLASADEKLEEIEPEDARIARLRGEISALYNLIQSRWGVDFDPARLQGDSRADHSFFKWKLSRRREALAKLVPSDDPALIDREEQSAEERERKNQEREQMAEQLNRLARQELSELPQKLAPLQSGLALVERDLDLSPRCFDVEESARLLTHKQALTLMIEQVKAEIARNEQVKAETSRFTLR
jgi:hypothetical protein